MLGPKKIGIFQPCGALNRIAAYLESVCDGWVSGPYNIDGQAKHFYKSAANYLPLFDKEYTTCESIRWIPIKSI
jgi:hypothetical protein